VCLFLIFGRTKSFSGDIKRLVFFTPVDADLNNKIGAFHLLYFKERSHATHFYVDSSLSIYKEHSVALKGTEDNTRQGKAHAITELSKMSNVKHT
jgi:hypothetical protein